MKHQLSVIVLALAAVVSGSASAQFKPTKPIEISSTRVLAAART